MFETWCFLPKGPIDSALADLVDEETEEILGASKEADFGVEVADIV